MYTPRDNFYASADDKIIELVDLSEDMQVKVITDDLEVRQSALSLGAGVLPDPEGAEGLGPVLDSGLKALGEPGAVRALLCMSDLPRLNATEIRAMLDALDDAEMVIAADREGEGTNALGLRLPFAGPTAFGNEDSARRHQTIADDAGLRLTHIQLPGLAWDIDGPADLLELGDEWEGDA